MPRPGESYVVMLYLSLLGCFAASAAIAGSIFVDVFNSDGSTARRLLQQKTQCKANFESANYSIVTSKCKAPKYPRDICCSAFKELVCPYRDYIDDLKSDCADVMFSYLNAAGGYPTALFSSMCGDTKEGLNCTGIPIIGTLTSASVGMSPSSVVIFLVGWLSPIMLF